MDNLFEYSLSESPIDSFVKWYEAAKLVEQNPEAMSLSTFDTLLNRPDSRTVLFKGLKDQSMTFYTNYKSQKGLELASHQEVSVLFYWHVSKKQVKIHGTVTKMSEEESRVYFNSRDRQSQLASYISDQSKPIKDKQSLLSKLHEAEKKFDQKPIPHPSHWGGYYIKPYEFEFFLYGEFRLNDRFLYKQSQEGSWIVTRLQP